MVNRPVPIVLVTGVSRAINIGEAIVRRLRSDGATVVATGWPPHDESQPWAGGAASDEAPRRHDLGDASVPAALVDEVYDEFGRLDAVVAAHARSSSGGLADVDAAELDACWAVNVRSVVLLAQRWADRRRDAGETADGVSGGRMVWFTSGQHLGPMDGELAYALSKGALHQLVRSLDRSLAEVGVIANCINPGPVDTGYAVGDGHAAVAAMFPDGRWTTPDQTADLVAFLLSERGSLFRGQVLDAENGFDRYV